MTSLITTSSYTLAGFVLPELMMLNSDSSKILVLRRKTLVPGHTECIPLNLKQLLPGHLELLMLVDHQINEGVTILIEITDPNYHEELDLLILTGTYDDSMPRENEKWAISELLDKGEVREKQPKAQAPQG